MVSAVSFGNFFNLNGKTVLAGAGGSGIDTQSLIAGLVTAKSQPATNDQTQITANNAQTTALNQFQQLLNTFQSASQTLANPPGVGSNANNVFQFTTGSVGNGGSSYFSVSTSAGAALQTYNISDITSLAASATQTAATFAPTSADAVAVADTDTAGMFTAGQITFASGATVTLTDTDTLNTIASKFNAVSSVSGVTATVVQVDSSHFQMAFTSTKTGSANSFDLTNAAESTITSGASLLSNIGLSTAVAGGDANFKLNGIAITRSSNNINDVINDVTFNLQATTPTDPDPLNPIQYPVTVAPDTTTIQNEMVAWVNAYNAIQTFSAQQTQLNSDGTYASTAVLANNQTFRNIMTDLNQQIVSQVSGLASGSNGLADFGITLTDQPATATAPAVNNILTVDDGALTSALSTDFSDVRNIFGINFTSSSPNLEAFSIANTVMATSFTLDADPVGGTFTATIDGGSPIVLTSTALPGGGYTLTGPAGTSLAGMVMVYGGTSAESINVTLTQGVAAQAYNTTTSALTAKTGLVPVALQTLADSDTQLNKDIANINTLVTQYQNQLVAQFTALETAVSNVNSLLASLNANSVAAQEAANIS